MVKENEKGGLGSKKGNLKMEVKIAKNGIKLGRIKDCYMYN